MSTEAIRNALLVQIDELYGLAHGEAVDLFNALQDPRSNTPLLLILKVLEHRAGLATSDCLGLTELPDIYRAQGGARELQIGYKLGHHLGTLLSQVRAYNLPNNPESR